MIALRIIFVNHLQIFQLHTESSSSSWIHLRHRHHHTMVVELNLSAASKYHSEQKHQDLRYPSQIQTEWYLAIIKWFIHHEMIRLLQQLTLRYQLEAKLGVDADLMANLRTSENSFDLKRRDNCRRVMDIRDGLSLS